ncbi:MAG: hypothetical protein EXQ71_04405 [Acidimicrobiia bacterium]|nr:hypothetical protein [Acidimicrobiia bacterium]
MSGANKTPGEQAIEVLVYAPIGLLFEGASLLPQLIETGRGQVATARMIGRFALRQGRGEASKVATNFQDQTAGWLDAVGGRRAPVGPVPAANPDPAPVAVSPVPKASARGRRGASSLAIADYDNLSASQVVNRLAGLTTSELEAVRRHESTHRGRKTILSKVAQLQGG